VTPSTTSPLPASHSSSATPMPLSAAPPGRGMTPTREAVPDPSPGPSVPPPPSAPKPRVPPQRLPQSAASAQRLRMPGLELESVPPGSISSDTAHEARAAAMPGPMRISRTPARHQQTENRTLSPSSVRASAPANEVPEAKARSAVPAPTVPEAAPPEPHTYSQPRSETPALRPDEPHRPGVELRRAGQEAPVFLASEPAMSASAEPPPVTDAGDVSSAAYGHGSPPPALHSDQSSAIGLASPGPRRRPLHAAAPVMLHRRASGEDHSATPQLGRLGSSGDAVGRPPPAPTATSAVRSAPAANPSTTQSSPAVAEALSQPRGLLSRALRALGLQRRTGADAAINPSGVIDGQAPPAGPRLLQRTAIPEPTDARRASPATAAHGTPSPARSSVPPQLPELSAVAPPSQPALGRPAVRLARAARPGSAASGWSAPPIPSVSRASTAVHGHRAVPTPPPAQLGELPAAAMPRTPPSAVSAPAPAPPPTTSGAPAPPPTTVARKPLSPAASSPPGPTSGLNLAAGGGLAGGGSGTGVDVDHIYRELLRRLREEREQLGQAIDEPF
jgi:hypothetical protein